MLGYMGLHELCRPEVLQTRHAKRTQIANTHQEAS